MHNKYSVISIMFVLLSSLALAQRLPCSEAEGRRALDESYKQHSWDTLYRWHQVCGHCNDGAAAEGVSESIARILVDHWTTLPRLAKLTNMNAGFRRFVLGGINGTLDIDDVRRIREKAMTCSKGLVPLCRDLGTQADTVIAENSRIPSPQ